MVSSSALPTAPYSGVIQQKGLSQTLLPQLSDEDKYNHYSQTSPGGALPAPEVTAANKAAAEAAYRTFSDEVISAAADAGAQKPGT